MDKQGDEALEEERAATARKGGDDANAKDK